MKPKKFILLSSFLIASSFVQAQEIEREVVATSGDQHSGAGLIVEWTLGEVMIDSAANSTVILTQGFHQGSKVPTGISTNYTATQLYLFPNPTKGILHYKLNQQEQLQAIAVFDLNGRQLVYLREPKGQVDLSSFAEGVYALRFLFKNAEENFTELIIKR